MPDDGLGVVALSNEHTPLKHDQHRCSFPERVVDAIYAYLLTGAPAATAPSAPAMPAMTTLAAAIEEPGQYVQSLTLSPGDYTGLFSHAGYGDVAVTSNGAQLSMSYFQQTWPLRPLSPDDFYFPLHAFGADLNMPVSFGRNSAGAVVKLSIPLEHRVPPIQFMKR
jgi:hypothetical protein